MPPDAQRIDLGCKRIIPGLIDLHIHGLAGHDVSGPHLAEMIRLLPRHAVTAFLPTAYPTDLETFPGELSHIASILSSPPAGSLPLGIHLEGPFLSKKRPGMARPELLYPLTRAAFDELQQAAGGHIRMLTFAPEEAESLSLISYFVEQGVIPVVGHSDADFETIRQAVALGLNHATHTFNAMRPLHHREPGVVGAVMYFPQIIAQLIADGQHVHPAVMSILIRVKGPQGVCLVSDAQPFATMAPGTYSWGPYSMVLDGHSSHLPDGTLAGSVMMMNQMLRVLVNEVGLSFSDALVMGTEVPAQVLGLKKGRLAADYDADLVAIDEDYQAIFTMINGEVVFSQP